MSAQRETALRVQTVGRITNLADTLKLSPSVRLCNYFMDTKEAGCV
jgi:hypothetical protein